MAHSHLGCQSPKDYFTEQLLTILVCGGLGFVGIQMYRNDMLKHILAPQFHLPVVIGSAAVLILVAVRAVTVWREAGQLQPVDDMSCQQNHVHSSACNHLPGLPTGTTPDENLVDDHGHSHDMSWVFARMLILVFPIALFALGIPNSGFSQEKLNKMLQDQKALNMDPAELERMATDPAAVTLETIPEADGSVVRVIQPPPPNEKLRVREVIASAGSKPTYAIATGAGIEMRFNDLNDAAFDSDKRKSYTGQTAILEGKFNRITDKEFTLYRLKMTCCGPDAVMLKVRIIAPQVPAATEGEWVRVRGVIRFVKSGQTYTPVLMLNDIAKDIDRGIKVNNEYEF